jgi:hypothetical protein
MGFQTDSIAAVLTMASTSNVYADGLCKALDSGEQPIETLAE